MSDLIFPNNLRSNYPTTDTMVNNHALMWVAYYRDNKIIAQYSENSSPKTLDEIPRLNLKKIALLDNTGVFRCSQDYMPGQTPLFRTRTYLTPGKGLTGRVYILGWVCWETNSISKMNVAFINEADFSVEMGHFVSGPGAGVKYPIELTEIDYKPIEWN